MTEMHHVLPPPARSHRAARLENAKQILSAGARGLPHGPKQLLFGLQALSELKRLGWHRSLKEHAPQDLDGEATPWWTYPAVVWLGGALKEHHRVFEFGSGASTEWLSQHVSEVVSVESDAEWMKRSTVRDNVTIVYAPASGDWWAEENAAYVSVIEQGSPWDVVIIDGAARNMCAREAPQHLRRGGLILLDDTGLAECRSAIAELSGLGLRRLDFWGFKPGVGAYSCTSMFSESFDEWSEVH